MKRIEITHISNVKEVSKLSERLAKAEAKLEKKIAIAEKLGVADWDKEKHSAWLATVDTQDGWIVNKADVKKNGAWFDVLRAKREVKELTHSLENAEKRLVNVEKKLAEYREEVQAIEDLKAKEELAKLEFEQEQKEWAKDGIELESRYTGRTPSGKRFMIYGNWGFTKRSLHCFTLRIDGNTVFTSGEFWRAYAVIKNS